MADPIGFPGVVVWFKIYAGFMVLGCLWFALTGVVMLATPQEFESQDMTRAEALAFGTVLLASGLAFAAAYVFAIFAPVRPWVWALDLILIAVGLLSCCCLPVTVPLLIFYLRSDTQNYFGA